MTKHPPRVLVVAVEVEHAAHASERMLALPSREKDRDDIDALRCECPACFARRGSPCAWAAPGVVTSWLAHQARRALVVK